MMLRWRRTLVQLIFIGLFKTCLKSKCGGTAVVYFCFMEFFLMNDQPFTCPYCGCRCTIIGDFAHTITKLLVQECLRCNIICGELEDNG